MFDSLTDRFDGIFKRLRGHGRITESHMTEALREVRMALLEADVALPVVQKFTESIREQALGQEVLRSLTPEQMKARGNVLISAFKIARRAVREAIKTP